MLFGARCEAMMLKCWGGCDVEGEGGAGFQKVISALFMFLSNVFGVGRPGTSRTTAPAHKVAGCGLRCGLRELWVEG